MTTTTASPPVLARALIVGSGVMSLANSVTVPFLAVFACNATMALSSSAFGPVHTPDQSGPLTLVPCPV